MAEHEVSAPDDRAPAVSAPAASAPEASTVEGGTSAASIPFAIVSIVVTVLALGLFALQVPIAGMIAAAVMTIAVVLAVVAIVRAASGARGRVLAVVALGLAVAMGAVSTAVGAGTTIAFANSARESGAPSWESFLAGDAAAPADDAQISGQWVVDELLRECRAGHLHAVPAPDSTTLFLVGERPVSVDSFTFTVTVDPGDDTWTGAVRGDVPAGSPTLSGDSVNPLGCESIALDAQSGNGTDAAVDDGSSDDAGGTDAPPAPEGEVNYWELEVGMCLNDADLPERFMTIPLVDCSAPHDSEVYAIKTLDEGAFPGDEEIFRIADEYCLDAFESYVGVAYDDSLYYFGYYWPAKSNWGAGERDIVCIIYDQNGQIEGSVRGSGR